MENAPGSDFSDNGFQLGQCPSCAREVLTYPSFALDDPVAEETQECAALCCVHCDTAVTEGLRLVSGTDLPDVGYGLLELQGCGNPDCGGGRCSRELDETPDS